MILSMNPERSVVAEDVHEKRDKAIVKQEKPGSAWLQLPSVKRTNAKQSQENHVQLDRWIIKPLGCDAVCVEGHRRLPLHSTSSFFSCSASVKRNAEKIHVCSAVSRSW